MRGLQNCYEGKASHIRGNLHILAVLSPHPSLPRFLQDPRGAGLHEAFQILRVHMCVLMFVSTLDFSFILHAKFT